MILHSLIFILNNFISIRNDYSFINLENRPSLIFVIVLRENEILIGRHFTKFKRISKRLMDNEHKTTNQIT